VPRKGETFTVRTILRSNKRTQNGTSHNSLFISCACATLRIVASHQAALSCFVLQPLCTRFSSGKPLKLHRSSTIWRNSALSTKPTLASSLESVTRHFHLCSFVCLLSQFVRETLDIFFNMLNSKAHSSLAPIVYAPSSFSSICASLCCLSQFQCHSAHAGVADGQEAASVPAIGRWLHQECLRRPAGT